MREYQSITSLQKFLECPRCYWLNYVAGLGEESSPAQELGSQVHEAIRRYHSDELDSSFLEGLTAEATNLFEAYRQNIKKDEVDRAECEFLVPIKNIVTGEQLPVKLKGIIDGKNTQNGWIFEHKTASQFWLYDDVTTNIQATAYSYAYYIEENKLPEGIRFNVLKKNKIKCKYQPLETYRTLEDLIYFFNWVKGILEEMEISDYAPKQTRFNYHHRLCPYSGN